MGRDDLFSVDDVAPAVFGAEHEVAVDDEAEQEDVPPPEALYVPSERVDAPQDEVTIQLNRTEDNELVLLAFSSPERLAVCLGDEQPFWPCRRRRSNLFASGVRLRSSNSTPYYLRIRNGRCAIPVTRHACNAKMASPPSQ
ncbi:SAV_915 family protein [Saccharopolyspora rhizosphaerae]|nr:SAV_915 family protein [Saccharopolyspora rhizosphaerae]